MSEVNLIALSSPSAITECHTAGELIAYTARVSNPANQNNTETAPRLLSYLIREQHWSPFEMVHMTLEIKTTRDIARQILRHRSFSFQEFSQRYAVAPGFESREARLQDEKNRQNSVETDDRNLNEWWQMEQKKVQARAEMSYKDALSKGVAKEQARALLPEGLTQSTLYMAGSLRSWIHYCELRRGNGTQKEHMEVADKCWEIIRVHFPDIVKALEDD
jgi:thymidylate synthase (FAD)